LPTWPSSPEFEDFFAQYVKTAAQSKASEMSGHYGQEKIKEALFPSQQAQKHLLPSARRLARRNLSSP
jgi:hypothetical protein